MSELSATPLGKGPVRGVLGLALLLALTGCSIHIGKHTTDSRPPDIAHSRLVDNTLRLDLRRHPTRDDLGMNPTTSFAGYGSTDKPITAVVDLPGTTLTFPRTDITFATDATGGASDPSPAEHQPRFFTLYVHYPDRAAARADALTRASALGLRDDQVDEALEHANGWYDVYGTPNGWLSARLGFNGGGSSDPSYTGFYFFDLDVFHNDVLDQIKRGDTVLLDLRTPPSRSALGFLPGYQLADISADPGRRLTVEIRSPLGTGKAQLAEPDRVGSSSDGPDGLPTVTFLQPCDSPRAVRSFLLGLADSLGVDRDRIEQLPTSSTAPAVQRTFTGRTTTFRTEITYSGADTTYDAACVKVALTYER